MDISSEQIIMVVSAIAGSTGVATIIVKLMNRGLDKAETSKIEGSLTIDFVDDSKGILDRYEIDYKQLREEMKSVRDEMALIRKDNINMRKRIGELESEVHKLEKENLILKTHNT